MNKKDIVRAIHNGVFSAHQHFERLSRGAWMTDPYLRGIEGFAVSHIFRCINTLAPDQTPILELPFDYLKWWTDADAKGRPAKGARPRRRVDVAIFNRQGKPIHVVEVKLQWRQRKGMEDIKKLELLLTSFGPRRNGTLKSVFLSVYWQGTNRPALEQKMKDVEREIGRNVDASVVKPEFYRHVRGPERRDDGKDWEYGSHVIVLSRRNRKRE